MIVSEVPSPAVRPADLARLPGYTARMSEPWFFHAELQPGRLVLDPDESHHARNVRRLQPGDPVALFDGAGRVARGTIAADGSGAARRRTDVAVDITQIEQQPPDSSPLTIISAACKGDRQAWMVEKLTELGAAALEFADFERSVVHIQPASLTKLRRTSREACKQCRRAYDLQITAGESLADAVRAWREAHPAGRLFFGDAAGAQPSPAGGPGAKTEAPSATAGAAPRATFAGAGPAAVVIGPEGGLTDAEMTYLSQAGATPIRVGRYILRIETAAIACAAAWAAQHVLA
jgi:16S rRNA (uracil1498-N3)-methyltransferase